MELVEKWASRDKLIRELFGLRRKLLIAYLRISLGASWFGRRPFTYDEMPAGQTDVALTRFNLSRDTLFWIPLLKRILAIHPRLKIMASPWTAPLWMKPITKALAEIWKQNIRPVTPSILYKLHQRHASAGHRGRCCNSTKRAPAWRQTIPAWWCLLHTSWFYQNHLGPAFKAASIDTKLSFGIIITTTINITAVLSDAAAGPFIDGSAFHLYGGDEGARSLVHDAHPEKNLYFTGTMDRW